jgi:hypothetical protein
MPVGAGPPNGLQHDFFAKQLMASWMFWTLKSNFLLQRQPSKSNTKDQIFTAKLVWLRRTEPNAPFNQISVQSPPFSAPAFSPPSHIGRILRRCDRGL